MSDPFFKFISTNPFGISQVRFSSPAFVDIDGDGDLDAFVGDYDGNILFFRNTGTANNPIFAAASTNPFGLSDVGYMASPAFVDIDGDGDLDAFVGNFAGNMLFFRNTGTANNPIFAAASTNPFGLSDVGSYATPAFVDIDSDGDLDAFAGNRDGNMLFFRNTGTAGNPIFAAASTNPFGLSDVGFVTSPTFVDIDGDGDLDAFAGNSYGNTLFFRNIGTVNNPVFSAGGSNRFGLSDVGYYATPTFVDIDGDNDLDVFIGESNSTSFFENSPSGILLFSTSGNNILTGTSSLNDTVSYASATAAVTVSLAIATQQNTIGAGLDTLTNIENLIGSGFNDNIKGNSKNNVLEGGIGNDTLNGGAGTNIFQSIDNMVGGLGNDIFVVNNYNDFIAENSGEGTDIVRSNVNYTLPANVENLTLTANVLAVNGIGNDLANNITGSTSNNSLFGLSGNDTLNGGAGADRLVGGIGNDIYVIDDTGDVVIENFNEGTDKVNSSITYSLPFNVENLTLTGALAINGTGNSLANTLTGNSAANVLNGGTGNDKLDGGIGTNTLTGGSGSDIFKITTTGHVDTFTDFVVVDDTIQLENSVFTALTTLGTLNINQFRIGTNALDANDFIIYNSTAGKLFYDADGSSGGAALEIATVGAGLAMTNADIVVI